MFLQFLFVRQKVFRYVYYQKIRHIVRFIIARLERNKKNRSSERIKIFIISNLSF